MPVTQKITTNLWFHNRAEEAANFYCSIFKNSYIGRTARFGSEGLESHGQPEGSVMVVEFHIDDNHFTAMNGKSNAEFNESISFIVNCVDQEEVDYYWEKLSENSDPASQQSGWLKDKFGISWQIVPIKFIEMVSDPDRKRSQRVVKAVFKMKRLILKDLEQAYNG